MIHNYNEYIILQEGTSNGHSNLYQDNDDFKDTINKEWSELSISFATSTSSMSIYKLKFHAGDNKYDYFSVLIENVGNDDIYYLADGLAEKFKVKFKQEFERNIDDWRKFKYIPKCLNITKSDLEGKEDFNL